MKILFFLASFISKIKTADIFNFLSVKYFDKGLLFLKIWHIRVNYCRNYEPSNLLLCFFHNHLCHLNKNSRRLDNTLFWKLTRKQLFGASFNFFDRPTTKWRSFKFFVKLNGNHIIMVNFPRRTFCQKIYEKTSWFQNRFWKYWSSFTASSIFMIWIFFEICTEERFAS